MDKLGLARSLQRRVDKLKEEIRAAEGDTWRNFQVCRARLPAYRCPVLRHGRRADAAWRLGVRDRRQSDLPRVS